MDHQSHLDNGQNAVYEIVEPDLDLDQALHMASGLIPDSSSRSWKTRRTARSLSSFVYRRVVGFPDVISLAITLIFPHSRVSKNPRANQTSELRALVGRAAQRRGTTATFTAAGGGSDGNFTAAAGIPTLDGFGPVGHRLCSLEERAEIETAVERTELLVDVLELLAGD